MCRLFLIEIKENISVKANTTVSMSNVAVKNKISIEDNFTKYKVIRTYMGAFFLIAVSFIAITILVTKLNINTDNVDDGQKEVQKKHQIYQPVR